MGYYYTRDHLGSVREMLNSSGSIVARYAYDPYGRATLVSGTNTASFQYTGDYYHATSGLNLTLYRAYDANQGRWLSRDPIEENGGVNLYDYVSNNTINTIDSLGLAGGPWHPPDDLGFGCKWTDSCATLYAKAWLFQKAIKSHEGWEQNKWKAGAVRDHSEEIKGFYNGLNKCYQIWLVKCFCPTMMRLQLQSMFAPLPKLPAPPARSALPSPVAPLVPPVPIWEYMFL